MKKIKKLCKSMVQSVTVPVLAWCLGRLDGRRWVPVFYFFLPRQNTNVIQVLHVLHKIQVETARRIVVVSPWLFWPWDTAKDPFFTSFIKGLNPKIRYIWIPRWVERFACGFTLGLWRLLQIRDALFRPMGLNSTIRFTSYSTLDHTDILNHGSRVAVHIPKSHEHTLQRRLHDLGVSSHDWFVCVHAREHGWHRDMKADDLKLCPGFRHEEGDHRNVAIRDYFPAIDYITSRGGLVVRLGDPSMVRVKGIDGVIDYPFTEHKSLPMDLYLVSRCRFLLGCTSGVSSGFPAAFGTPLLITNFPGPVFSARFPYSNTLVLLKHMVERDSGRHLRLEEMFHPSVSTLNDSIMLEAMGYRWVSNSPEDILKATEEMLHLIESDAFDSPRSSVQELFHQYRLRALDSLWSPSEGRGNPRWSNVRTTGSRLSATFASRHFEAEGSELSAMEMIQS